MEGKTYQTATIQQALRWWDILSRKERNWLNNYDKHHSDLTNEEIYKIYCDKFNYIQACTKI